MADIACEFQFDLCYFYVEQAFVQADLNGVVSCAREEAVEVYLGK